MTIKPIHTERLLHRQFTLEDAEAYLPLLSDPDVIRYTGEPPHTTLEAVLEVLLTRPIRDYAVHGYGRMACIEKSTGRLIGFSGLKFLEDLQEVDIGYRFLPDYWGKGYATESAKAFIEHAYNELRIPRIIGLVQPENTASAIVLQKIGLLFERKIILEDCEFELDLYATPRAT